MAKKLLQGIPLMPDDFKEFVQCLNSNNVEYLLIGASGRSMDIADVEKLEKRMTR